MATKTDQNKIKIISISTFLIVISGGLFWKTGIIPEKSKDISGYTIPAKNGRLPGFITASGELRSKKTVNIGPKRQGILLDIFVEEGDKVKENQLIAKMDGGDLLYRINELKAEFEKQKADFERRKILYNEGAISLESFDEYKNLFLKSQARLNQRDVEKNDLEIRAPFTGIITSKLAVPGAFVSPTATAQSSLNENRNKPTIVELSQGLEVIAKVPESDIGRIKIEQSALVRVDAFPDQRFAAKVNKISPRALKSNNVTSFEVTLLLTNRPKKLRIGMTADIEFQADETLVNTLVPTVAIVTKNGEPGVLIVGENNEPKFKKVELGTSSGSRTAIIEGLAPGELVFIDLPPWSKQNREQ